MNQDGLLSTDMAWWIAGAAALLLLLIAPRLRRRRRGDVQVGGPGDGRGSAPSEGEASQAPRCDETSEEPRRISSAPHTPGEENSGDAALGAPASLRLEAARVYLELGDTAGAEAMLEQVAQDGDDDENAAANGLRRELKSKRESSTGDSLEFDAENLLDLATAYVEIGDAESARRMVERIERVGSEEQRRQARSLLERL